MEFFKLGTPMTSDTRLRYALGAAIGFGILGAPELAWTDAQVLGEIVVIARQRSENPHTVAVSVSAHGPVEIGKRLDMDVLEFASAVIFKRSGKATA